MLDRKEARRYLGLKRDAPEMEALLQRAETLLSQAAAPKGIWRRFPVTLVDDQVSFAGMEILSRSLSSHLNGCREVYLLSATLGIGVDRLIARLSVTDISLCLAVQACAAAFLERCCDDYQAQIAAEVSREGLSLRPRFSPGYGDFPLSCQPSILRILDAGKYIGLTSTDADMLVPTKSITAVIGLSSDPASCHAGGCRACGKQNCDFRCEE